MVVIDVSPVSSLRCDEDVMNQVVFIPPASVLFPWWRGHAVLRDNMGYYHRTTPLYPSPPHTGSSTIFILLEICTILHWYTTGTYGNTIRKGNITWLLWRRCQHIIVQNGNIPNVKFLFRREDREEDRKTGQVESKICGSPDSTPRWKREVGWRDLRYLRDWLDFSHSIPVWVRRRRLLEPSTDCVVLVEQNRTKLIITVFINHHYKLQSFIDNYLQRN